MLPEVTQHLLPPAHSTGGGYRGAMPRVGTLMARESPQPLGVGARCPQGVQQLHPLGSRLRSHPSLLGGHLGSGVGHGATP